MTEKFNGIYVKIGNAKVTDADMELIRKADENIKNHLPDAEENDLKDYPHKGE